MDWNTSTRTEYEEEIVKGLHLVQSSLWNSLPPPPPIPPPQNTNRVLLMKRKRGKRRPPRPFQWNESTPVGIMRRVFEQTRKAILEMHNALVRIWKCRDAWLEKGRSTGNVPPGALCKQKDGRPFPHWETTLSQGGRRPILIQEVCTIYAIVNLQNGKTYVGRTIKNPYVRFYEHMGTGDMLGKAIEQDPNRFVVITLETVPMDVSDKECVGTRMHWRVRENSWIHRLNSLKNGYNTRREIKKPDPPTLPSHGFGKRPVKKSRHGTRITKTSVGVSAMRVLSKDWKRRVDFLTGLIKNKPHMVDAYIKGLSRRNMVRMIRYIGQGVIEGDVKQTFK